MAEQPNETQQLIAQNNLLSRQLREVLDALTAQGRGLPQPQAPYGPGPLVAPRRVLLDIPLAEKLQTLLSALETHGFGKPALDALLPVIEHWIDAETPALPAPEPSPDAAPADGVRPPPLPAPPPPQPSGTFEDFLRWQREQANATPAAYSGVNQAGQPGPQMLVPAGAAAPVSPPPPGTQSFPPGVPGAPPPPPPPPPPGIVGR